MRVSLSNGWILVEQFDRREEEVIEPVVVEGEEGAEGEGEEGAEGEGAGEGAAPSEEGDES